MTQQQKINWALAGVLVLSLVYLSMNKNPEIDASALNRDLVLTSGSYGAEVLELQRLLKEKYGAYLGDSGENHDGLDGDFGNLTAEALRKFKGANSISLNQFNA